MTPRQWLAIKGNTQEKLAGLMGVTQGAVSAWVIWLDDPSRGTKLTAERCIEMEQATGGEICRYDTLPKIFGAKPAIEKAA